ncbi:hypothetical protein [Streptomyces sp. NBC_00162]|uniref:hypothetical protein n=1 Tax=Streptomyces sp. NBC_00162 TaxID=2903629 RepID=UPI00214B19DF|nr:hypothetical protein [Streptomyces sp. NBC_00162]UUU44042.1 hypothetical protein JIW86_37745 [Streptomyces sp. NBC_00162]
MTDGGAFLPSLPDVVVVAQRTGEDASPVRSAASLPPRPGTSNLTTNGRYGKHRNVWPAATEELIKQVQEAAWTRTV